MGRRFGGSVAVCFALVAMAGCSLSFPAVSKPKAYRCKQASDCAPGYGCVAGYCSAGNAGSDGGTITDGGTTGDGGTVTDGGTTGDGGTVTDGGTTGDGGTVTDGGVPMPDGGVPPPDGGVPPPDGGVPPPDGGVPPPDGGVPPPDGGVPMPDGGTVTDGGTTADGGIPISACSFDMAASPDVVPPNLPVPITVFLPPGVTPSNAQANGEPMGSLGSTAAPWRFTLPSDLASTTNAATTYDLRVDDGLGGCYRTPITVAADATPSGLTLDRSGGPAQKAFPIVLTPTSAAVTPDMPMWAYAIGTNAVYPLTQVEWLTLGSVRAVVPSLPAGTYAISLVALTGGSPASPVMAETSSGSGLKLVTGTLPTIGSVAPVAIPTSSIGGSVPIVLHGTGFAVNDKVSLECNNVFATAHLVTASELTGTAPNLTVKASVAVSSTAAMGDHCQLRYASLGNADLAVMVGRMVVANDTGVTAASWKTLSATPLQTPRLAAGAAIASLPDGSRYLVVAGGANLVTSSLTALDTTEVAEVNDDGTLQPFHAGPNLPAVRSSPAVAAFRNCVYVIGGYDGTLSTASSTIYRACLRDRDQRPSGVNATVTFPAGATKGLANGSIYFYAVSAGCDAGENSTINEKSPASVPVPVWIPQGATSKVQVDLSWASNCNASWFTIYRGTQPNNLGPIFTNTSGTLTSWTDDGSRTPSSGVVPHTGELSSWSTLTEAPTAPRAGAAVAVLPPTPGVPAQLVLVAGDNGGPTDTAESWQIQSPPGAGQSLASHSSAGTILSHPRKELQGRVIGPGWSTNPSYANAKPWILLGPGMSQVDSPIPWVRGYTPGFASADSSGPTNVSHPVVFLGLYGLDVLGIINGTTTAEGWVDYSFSGSTPNLPGTWSVMTGQPDLPATFLPKMASAQDGGDCYLIGGNTSTGSASTVVEHTTR